MERIVSSAKDASPEEKIKASLEARQIMKKHDASPFGSLVPMLAQAGIVFTVFLALQGMAKLPVESLKNGGVAWFRDLSVPDPTYYLPALASLVFLGGLEVRALETPGWRLEVLHLTFFVGRITYRPPKCRMIQTPIGARTLDASSLWSGFSS